MKIGNRLLAYALVFVTAATAAGIAVNNRAAANMRWLDSSELSSTDTVSNVIMYQNGTELKEGEPDYSADIKKLYVTDENCLIYDYSGGYTLRLPNGMTPDYSLAKYVSRYESEDLTAVISAEDGSAYSSADKYYENTFCGRLSDETFQENNALTFNEISREQAITCGCVADLFRGEKPDLSDSIKAKYSYIYIRENADSKIFYRIMLKYKSDYDFERIEKLIFDSFSIFEPRGEKVNNADYQYPVIPDYWTEETKRYYRYLCDSDTTQWGLYFYQNYAGLEREHFFESQVDSRFDLVMYYISMQNLEFDVNFARRAYEEDKVTVLTVRYQDSTGRNICFPFDIVSGKYDRQFEKLADNVNSFGHPVIIRMENEFNGNWTDSGALCSLGDPDWYRDAWIHIYEIFLKRGVRNAMFMSNPESEQTSYPKQNWLHYINYLPPKEYIQIIGLTAYNFGVGSDSNKSFSEIYTGVAANNTEFFGNWPWVIGEFGCAGPNEGVDKAKWIKQMFDTIDMFPNIKGAIWFDSSDFASDGSVLRDFRLSSPAEAGVTFLECIKSAKAKSQTGEWHFEN